MKCNNCNTINLNQNQICVNCSRKLISSINNENFIIGKNKKEIKTKLLLCPFCIYEFGLTWVRYFKAPSGNYKCPECKKISYLEKLWWTKPLFFLIGIFTIAPIEIYVLGNGNFTLAIVGFIIYLIFTLPLDKYVDKNYRRLEIR
jgi:hypothetical protein